jgi:hypothetical protein
MELRDIALQGLLGVHGPSECTISKDTLYQLLLLECLVGFFKFGFVPS